MICTRKDIENFLESIKNDDNSKVIEEYILKLSEIDEESFEKKILEYGNSREEIETKLKRNIEKKVQEKFIQLNDLISYGITNNTIHIHLIPISVRNMLNKKGVQDAKLAIIDALDKIRDMLKNNQEFSNIEKVTAISPILQINRLQDMFKELGFSIEYRTEERFLDMFQVQKKYMVQ